MKIGKAYREDGSPIYCDECGSRDLQDITVCEDRNMVYEFKVVCGFCATTVAWWAYGGYDPAFYMDKPDELR